MEAEDADMDAGYEEIDAADAALDLVQSMFSEGMITNE